MVFFNYALRKLNAKIVYYGPGLCGKTTNLEWIHDHFEGGDRGKMISLATEGDRTIFFDLLPLEIGSIRGMDVTLQLYTVPGQVHYNSTRQLVLRGADGVVFVADSQRALQTSNVESFRNLQENLLLQGISLEGFPLALQFNKRDLKDVVPVEELDSELNTFRAPFFESVATEGVGVQETLEGIVKLVMRSLRDRYEGAAANARSPGAGDPAATMRASAGAKEKTQVGGATQEPAIPPSADPEPPPQPAAMPPVAEATPPVAPEPPIATPEAPPVAFEPPPAVPDLPAVVSPADEIVFPEDDGASTRDFSKVAAPTFDGASPVTGFEDEVSTAVYDVGDELAAAPEVFDNLAADGDVFESPSVPAFVDEATKPGGAAPDVIEPPDAAEEGPAIDDALPMELLTPEEPPAVEEPVAAEEPVIEFMSGEGGDDTPPPTADQPPPAERYVDRIVAPSPFAPRAETAEADQGETPEADSGIDVQPPLGADEDREALGALAEDIMVDESSDPVIQVPIEEPVDEIVPPAAEEPFVVDDGDPFAEPEPELVEPAAIEPAQSREVAVRAEDNQLHLRLQGTGAIIESGQVRELEIEVPVPGSWVGNRRVTLQLRLTLTPDSEDENGESADTP